jgi:hypothetical protein
MPHINSPPWPTGTTVELYPAAGIAGNGEPATGTDCDRGDGVAGHPSAHSVTFSTSESGPMVATAVVAGKRRSVRFRLGG